MNSILPVSVSVDVLSFNDVVGMVVVVVVVVVIIVVVVVFSFLGISDIVIIFLDDDL
jgi:hypothetical protein